jgi:hypothetical protein
MKKKGALTIKQIEYHRNGISGIGFHAVLFQAKEDETGKDTMLGIVFPEEGAVAVIDLDMIPEHGVTFAENSWRGDWFEDDLRKAILKSTNEERAEYGLPPLAVLD